MKTQFFKISGLNFDNGGNFHHSSIEIGKDIKDLNNINKNNPALVTKDLYNTHEDELNIKIFHILYVLRNLKVDSKIELSNNFWIGTRLYTREFKKNRKLKYISGDFDFLVGSLDNNLKPIYDNIIGIETKKFGFSLIEKDNFNENYRNINENYDFKLIKQPPKKNNDIMQGLSQIKSYGYFCNKIILLYSVVVQPVPQFFDNNTTIQNAMNKIKEKYTEKISDIPDYIGFSINGLMQVPNKDPIYSGMPITPIILKYPHNHSFLLNNREDFIDKINRRLETAPKLPIKYFSGFPLWQ